MNCADLDDDNDGIPDALDPCPVGVDPFERDCQVVRDCACGSADVVAGLPGDWLCRPRGADRPSSIPNPTRRSSWTTCGCRAGHCI
ncbi:MAG: hypothetical protein M5U12_24630 [Verrucomicrobia bacterium]|nr:hypothetical protein [Verrucomicrobiota bacterium]